MFLAALVGCNWPDNNRKSTVGTVELGREPQRKQTQTATEIDASTIPERDDITSIVTLWPQWPWLSNTDGEIVGFRVPTYFVSGGTTKGAFVSGRVYCWLHALDRAADGSRTRTPVHTWELDRNNAMGFRVRKQVVGGYFYGFVLTWPRDVRLHGREVEVEFGYERGGGQLVMSGPRRFKVPMVGENAATRPVGSR